MANKIEHQKKVVEFMIRLYCKKREGNSQLCENCSALLTYSIERLERCRYGEKKPSCRKCPTHCYKPQMRQQIKTVMRWAGPRMMLYYPIAAIRHYFLEIRS